MADAPKDWKNAHGDRRGAAAWANGAANAVYNPGFRKGMLTVISVDRSNPKRPLYALQCDCGGSFTTGAYLAAISQCSQCRPKKPKGKPRKYAKKAGEYLLYKMWSGMKHRCNPAGRRKHNDRYGRRGIRVCEEWLVFSNFEAWALANGYQEGLSLDRLNPDGHYEPANCEWVTRSENSKRCRAAYQMVRVRVAETTHYPIEMLWGTV